MFSLTGHRNRNIAEERARALNYDGMRVNGSVAQALRRDWSYVRASLREFNY